MSLKHRVFLKNLKMASVKNIWRVGISLKTLNINRNVINTSSRHLSSSSALLTDKPTHTGQQWDDKDYRMVRFEETPKQINTQFAIDLIAKVPPAPMTKRVVSCDGGGGPTGHPKVYINLDKPGNHICGYCGLRFFKDGSHAH